MGSLPDRGRGLKYGINVPSGNARGKRQHHDRATEEAKFTGNPLPAEFIGK